MHDGVRYGRSRWWSGVALVLAVGSAVVEHHNAAADPSAAEELVFLLQYIGSDYGNAVREGKVASGFEYAEMLDFSDRASALYRELSSRPGIRSELEQLHRLIVDLAPWEEVRARSQGLVPRIIDELEVASAPTATPDLERGRRLYAEDCAPCHGPAGGGDGRASPGMEPPPTSFRKPQMDLLSPHQVLNAISLGISGTAMPAYANARTSRELWDVAFFVMTLRDGFDPRPPPEVVPLSLAELAERSNEQLLDRLRASRPEAGLREVDYYRAQIPRAPSSRAIEPAFGGGDADLDFALRLERAFSRVAEAVFPSVVGISLYEKDGMAATAPRGWKEGGGAEDVYPGFHLVRSTSGFLVTDDGDVLTSVAVLGGHGELHKDELIDVELVGNVHCRARLVGMEPTIDLAVLKIDPPVTVHAVAIGDSDRVGVGQWAIAVGDPPGPERTFAPGTISARPERDCYQEHRTSTLLQSSSAIPAQGFGGPLVNIRGEAVGLTVPGPGGTVNALPIDLAMTIYRALKVKESTRSPWIGVSVLELSSTVRRRLDSSPLTGIYIDDVFDPSPASRAGIRVGDVLTEMDGHRILAVADFQRWLYLLGIEATVKLEIFRDGKTRSIEVKIEQRPQAATTR